MKALLIGHRGAAGLAPENSLQAVLAGLDARADGVEVDLRLDGDGATRLLHDEDLLRTSGKPGLLSETGSSQIAAYNVTHSTPDLLPEEPPLLKALFDLLPSDSWLLLEWKEKPGRGFADKLRAARSHCNTALLSFDWDLLAELRTELPQYPCFGLLEKEQMGPGFKDWVRRAQDIGLHGLDLPGPTLRQRHVDLLHAAELECWAWQVEASGLAMRLCEAGVTALTSDRPDLLRKELEKGYV